MDEDLFFQERFQPGAVQRVLDYLCKPFPDVWPLTVPDCFDKQVASGFPVKLQFSQHVENLAAQGVSRFSQFVEKL